MATYIAVYADSYGPYQGAGNITPAPPSWTFNPDTRILTLSHTTLASSQLEFSYQNSAYQQYVAGLSVDAAAHAAADWKGRVKAAVGRNPSTSAQSPAIAALSGTPGAPTPWSMTWPTRSTRTW